MRAFDIFGKRSFKVGDQFFNCKCPQGISCTTIKLLVLQDFTW